MIGLGRGSKRRSSTTGTDLFVRSDTMFPSPTSTLLGTDIQSGSARRLVVKMDDKAGKPVAGSAAPAPENVRGRSGRRTVEARRRAVLELLGGKAAVDQVAIRFGVLPQTVEGGDAPRVAPTGRARHRRACARPRPAAGTPSPSASRPASLALALAARALRRDIGAPR